MMKNRLHFFRSLRAGEILQILQHLATFVEKQMYQRAHQFNSIQSVPVSFGLWDTALKFLSPGPRSDVTDHLVKPCATSYRKIPKISPGAYIFQRPFLRGL